MEKLRKFALCGETTQQVPTQQVPTQQSPQEPTLFAAKTLDLSAIAELVWNSAPDTVCSLLRVPKKSQAAAAKKKFSELVNYTTSVLRTKYGFTDTYEFDDPKLNHIQARIAELTERLRSFTHILSRVKGRALERVCDTFDACEIDNPLILQGQLDQEELAYEKRYAELVKNATLSFA